MAYRRVLSATTLMGDKVVNRQDEDLGKIEDFMIRLEDGCISYAVLSYGGWLGMGDKLFAVPWEALELDQEQKAFVLDASKEHLKNAPGFDRNHWPDVADRKWSDTVDSFYRGSNT